MNFYIKNRDEDTCRQFYDFDEIDQGDIFWDFFPMDLPFLRSQLEILENATLK